MELLLLLKLNYICVRNAEKYSQVRLKGIYEDYCNFPSK